MDKTNTIKSVDRSLEVLDILIDYPEGIGVTELSEILDVAKSTAFRILNSLMNRGYVEQNIETTKYYLGLKLLELGEIVSSRLDIKQIAYPYLYKIREATGETAHLAILDGTEIIYIDKIESYQTLRMFSNIGRRAPIYCTGIGKVIFANLCEDHIDRLLKEISINKFTDKTITDKELLKQELVNIKKRGYSLDDEEHEEGIKCSAAPIFNYKGEVIAGISVASPLFRLDDNKFNDMINIVLYAGTEISKELGYRKKK